MIRRLVDLTIWLGLVALIVGGLYWQFLNTPEASLPMLISSVVLLLVAVVVAAIGVTTGILLALGATRRDSLLGGLRTAHWTLLAAIPALLVVAGVLRLDRWVAERAGEISAWFIAALNWSDVSWLFQAERALSVWVRWVVVPLLALALITAAMRRGPIAAVSTRWLRAGLRFRTLLAATAAFLVLILLPWRLTPWAPIGSVPVSMEPFAAGARLLIVALVMTLGTALMVIVAALAADASLTRSR